MSELFKAALAGAWTWVITYVFPASLALGVLWVALSGLEPNSSAIVELSTLDAGQVAASAIATALLMAMVLAGLNNGLHRLLEGYVLLPRAERLWAWLVRRQMRRRDKLQKELAKSTATGPGSELRKALLRERLEDYPASDDQFGPTRYANSVRTLETYAVTRFRLDSQYLWGQLTACTPEAARSAEEDARAFVDFLVNLVFLTLALASTSAAVAVLQRDERWAGVALAFVTVTYIWNRLIYGAVRSWRSATRAVVDLGRAPLADALKLSLPAEDDKERAMWETLVWALRDQHPPSIAKLHEFRAHEPKTDAQAATEKRWSFRLWR